MDGSVCDAEIHMAGFISEHNLSFNVMDHFSRCLAAHIRCTLNISSKVPLLGRVRLVVLGEMDEWTWG